MLEDIEEMKKHGASEAEIEEYLNFCEEWAEINQENWEF